METLPFSAPNSSKLSQSPFSTPIDTARAGDFHLRLDAVEIGQVLGWANHVAVVQAITGRVSCSSWFARTLRACCAAPTACRSYRLPVLDCAVPLGFAEARECLFINGKTGVVDRARGRTQLQIVLHQVAPAGLNRLRRWTQN